MKPAWRLTKNSIWNSFQASNKRHLILTGDRGAGKTSLLKKLIPPYTTVLKTGVRQKKEVYLGIAGEEEEIIIGEFDEDIKAKENRMRPCLESLESGGVRLLEELKKGEGSWVAIDEIGYLECESRVYRESLLSLFENKQVIAVVRKQKLPFLEELIKREDVFVIDMDAPLKKLACVIMASGLGKRFGENKLMTPFLGKPLLQSILDKSSSIFYKQVVITRHESVKELCLSQDIPVIYHEFPHRSDTVRLGVEAMADADGILFCPGDQPLLKEESLLSMGLCAVNENGRIWCLSYEGKRGAPVLFPKTFFKELKELPTGQGGGYLVKKYPRQVSLFPAGDSLELQDIDYPKDLEYLSGR